MSDWDFSDSIYTNTTSSMDVFLSSPREEEPIHNEKNASIKRFVSGTPVEFSNSLEALLTYPVGPQHQEKGVVVKVRTAYGDGISFDGRVFVRWESGTIIPVYERHLNTRKGSQQKFSSSYRKVCSSLGDLSEFLVISSIKKGSNEDLVHKSSRELWTLSKGSEGYIIERLFNLDGDPLKG